MIEVTVSLFFKNGCWYVYTSGGVELNDTYRKKLCIGVGLLRDTLNEGLGKHTTNMARIVNIVSKETGISRKDIYSSSKKREVADARRMAIWMMRRVFMYKIHDILKHLNHTSSNTVVYGINRADEWFNDPRLNPEWVEKANNVINKLINNE